MKKEKQMRPIEIDTAQAARAGFELGLTAAPRETVDFVNALFNYCSPIDDASRLREAFNFCYGAGQASKSRAEFGKTWQAYLRHRAKMLSVPVPKVALKLNAWDIPTAVN